MLLSSKKSETPAAPTPEVSDLSVSTKELTMKSIATQISTINVPFHGDNLYLVNFDGQPYVPMKPVVEGMGLAWAAQFVKIKQRFSKGVSEIEIPSNGGVQSMTCLAFRKFAGWLHTINVGKVRPELREKVARYQEECDDVLYQYWTNGEVKNPRKTTVDQRTPLRDAVNMLVGKKGLRYDDAYTMVHQRFNIDSIDELSLEQIPLAVEYIHRVVLEGEFLGKQEELPAPKLDISFPMSWFAENAPYAIIRQKSGDTVSLDRNALVDCSPAYRLLDALTKAGYDVEAARTEIKALRTIMAEQSWALKEIASYTGLRDKACHSVRL
ncbi:phage antirepressor N-terminal domain-containing protein [Citrobacter sp. CK205]|nr:phage antirepressor N-terminal domain-containing protein [Citrobacter sp. CK205]MDM3132002.1 phage antirepressor N-terminal domain-containing protein [Citrobacter sp. CK205]